MIKRKRKVSKNSWPSFQEDSASNVKPERSEQKKISIKNFFKRKNRVKRSWANFVGKVKRGQHSESSSLERRARFTPVNYMGEKTTITRSSSSMKPKLAINHKKTIWYNSRNLAIEKFGRSMLLDDPHIYESPILLPNNLFNVYHLTVLQLLILSLPHSPTLCLALLVLSELLFMLLTVLPYWKHIKFISSLEFWSKVVRFVCMTGFFGVCLLIRITSPEEYQPVSQTLQNIGIMLISAGVLTTYLFTVIKLFLLVKTLLKEYLNKKKNKEKEVVEDLTKEQRGLIFYKEEEEEKKLKKKVFIQRKIEENEVQIKTPSPNTSDMTNLRLSPSPVRRMNSRLFSRIKRSKKLRAQKSIEEYSRELSWKISPKRQKKQQKIEKSERINNKFNQNEEEVGSRFSLETNKKSSLTASTSNNSIKRLSSKTYQRPEGRNFFDKLTSNKREGGSLESSKIRSDQKSFISNELNNDTWNRLYI